MTKLFRDCPMTIGEVAYHGYIYGCEAGLLLMTCFAFVKATEAALKMAGVG